MASLARVQCVRQLYTPTVSWKIMTQSLQNLPLGDSDVESEDEYLHDGEVEETEEDKRMDRFITAVRNGWVKT